MPKFGNVYTSIEDAKLCSEQFAQEEDKKDELSRLRSEFIIPTTGDLKNKKFGFQQHHNDANSQLHNDSMDEAIYFCGNSLGLQPRKTKEYVTRYLDTWASKGVFGHFTDYEGGLPPWLHIDEAIKEQTAKIVGASPSEVVVMETLTANLHLLMSSFYRPTKDRWKIIIEGKAFPSDHVRLFKKPPYEHCITDWQLVRCSLSNRPPQPQPFCTHNHRTALVVISIFV
jgi:kynureninase